MHASWAGIFFFFFLDPRIHGSSKIRTDPRRIRIDPGFGGFVLPLEIILLYDSLRLAARSEAMRLMAMVASAPAPPQDENTKHSLHVFLKCQNRAQRQYGAHPMFCLRPSLDKPSRYRRTSGRNARPAVFCLARSWFAFSSDAKALRRNQLRLVLWLHDYRHELLFFSKFKVDFRPACQSLVPYSQSSSCQKLEEHDEHEVFPPPPPPLPKLASLVPYSRDLAVPGILKGRRFTSYKKHLLTLIAFSFSSVAPPPPSVSLSLSLTLSLSLSLSLSSEGKLNMLVYSKTKRSLSCAIAEGVSPTSDGAGGGGGVATLIAGLARPNPWQQYGCEFTKGSRTHWSRA